MKKILSLFLSAILLVSSFSACTAGITDTAESSSASSVSYADAVWLETRLGEIPDGVTVGTASSLGIDMTNFENDGYIIRSTGGETVICGKTESGLDMACRKYAKAYEKNEASELNVSYHEGFRIKELRIGGADISEFTVIRPENTNANIDFAISELVRLIAKATGVTLPVSDTDVTGHKITFSLSDDEKYEDDGYTYTVSDGNLCFEGAVKRGNMNGVWRFLETELDWNGLTYGDSYLASSDLIEIENGVTRSETPAFACFTAYGNFTRSLPTEAGSPSAAQRGGNIIPQACHGMQNNRFCDEDYLSKQICYTDEDRYEECYENVVNYIERNVAAGAVVGETLNYIDIAQGDNDGFCTCKNCRAVLKEEKYTSGAMVRFSNRLATEINETYTGIYFLIFAYAGTNIAPAKTKPNEWIYVTFCFDGNCTNHKIDGTECTGKVQLGARDYRSNLQFVGWLKTWLEMTRQVYVWYYALDTCLKQYTTLRTLRDDLKYLDDLGVLGVFWEAEWMAFGVKHIEHMVANELNWNVNVTEAEYETMIDEMLQKEYGDGWEYVKRYLQIQCNAQERSVCWHCWNQSPSFVNADYYTSHFDEIYDLCHEAIDSADSRLEEWQAVNLCASALYEGAHSGYHDAYLANDTEKVEYWCDIYDEVMDCVATLGYDVYDGLSSWSGYTSQKYYDNLTEEVWRNFVNGEQNFSDSYYTDFRILESPIKDTEE